MARMSTPHSDIGPELRRLAQVILDRLDPAVRAAATMATETLSGPGREIALEFEGGYHFTQVYAPTDQPFICFEPMTAPTNALISGDRLGSVAPGEQFRAIFKLTARG